MGRVITLVALTGFGFRDIGVGIIITNTGSTAITHSANLGHFFDLGPPFEIEAGSVRRALDARYGLRHIARTKLWGKRSPR